MRAGEQHVRALFRGQSARGKDVGPDVRGAGQSGISRPSGGPGGPGARLSAREHAPVVVCVLACGGQSSGSGGAASAGHAGEPVTLPGSQLNIAVCGGTGKGKSYLAGLICEQLIRLGYSLVVFDPEGDHHGLGELHDVIITGGDEGRLAAPAEVVRLLRHGHASVVTDLSHLDAAARAAYAADLASAVEAHRAATGIPQWVVVDEAHGPIGRDPTARRLFDPAAEGYLLITWQPAELSADALVALDALAPGT